MPMKCCAASFFARTSTGARKSIASFRRAAADSGMRRPAVSTVERRGRYWCAAVAGVVRRRAPRRPHRRVLIRAAAAPFPATGVAALTKYRVAPPSIRDRGGRARRAWPCSGRLPRSLVCDSQRGLRTRARRAAASRPPAPAGCCRSRRCGLDGLFARGTHRRPRRPATPTTRPPRVIAGASSESTVFAGAADRLRRSAPVSAAPPASAARATSRATLPTTQRARKAARVTHVRRSRPRRAQSHERGEPVPRERAPLSRASAAAPVARDGLVAAWRLARRRHHDDLREAAPWSASPWRPRTAIDVEPAHEALLRRVGRHDSPMSAAPDPVEIKFRAPHTNWTTRRYPDPRGRVGSMTWRLARPHWLISAGPDRCRPREAATTSATVAAAASLAAGVPRGAPPVPGVEGDGCVAHPRRDGDTRRGGDARSAARDGRGVAQRAAVEAALAGRARPAAGLRASAAAGGISPWGCQPLSGLAARPSARRREDSAGSGGLRGLRPR